MKYIHAIIYALISCSSFGQQPIRYYTLSELKNAPIDSVIAIDLSRLKLTELPEIIFKFKELEYLNASKNNFQQMNGLEAFQKLRYLNVEKNKLDYFPISICQLTQLETLVMNRNYFESIPPCISQCQNLKSIDLWYTAVTMLPAELAKISTLELVDLTGVQINAKNQERIRGLLPGVTVKLSSPCNCTQ